MVYRPAESMSLGANRSQGHCRSAHRSSAERSIGGRTPRARETRAHCLHTDIRIVNTGTEFVRDGRIDIRVSDDAQLLSADIVDCPSDAAGEPAAHAETHKLGARLSFGYINSQ